MSEDKKRTKQSGLASLHRPNSSWRTGIKYGQSILQVIGVLWVVATLTFGLMQLTNDDVVDQVFSRQQSLSIEAQAEKRLNWLNGAYMVAIWPLALGRLTGRFRPIYGNRGSGQFFAVVKTAGYASSHGSGCRGYSVNSCADRPLDGTPKGPYRR